MRRNGVAGVLAMAAMLSACGGGGSGGGTLTSPAPTPAPTPTPSPTPSPTATAGCSLRDRQQWVAAQMNEWYLFPETLPASLDPAPYASLEDYLDALTATARSQNRDRYFTYVTSIREENAYYSSGTTGGTFGYRLGRTADRLVVVEAFEGGAALAAGLDRGTEITAIGTSASNLRTVASYFAANDINGLINAFGPDTSGVSRTLQVTPPGGASRTVTITKTDFELTPVSSRYGAKIIEDGGRRVGYINLRAFISTADPALRQAYANFRAQNITDIIIDVRYNSGGLLSIAELMGDLMGRNRATTDVFSRLTFRPSKASENETRTFQTVPESVAPTRLAFIGTEDTASASELVAAAFVPYLGDNLALIGSNTYGKPVGQIALDRASCDDRLRVIAFATENSAGQSGYYNGLARFVNRTCQANDDLGRPLGDPQEASTRAALDYLAGRACTPISVTATAQVSTKAIPQRGGNRLLTPNRPTTPQREVPGLF